MSLNIYVGKENLPKGAEVIYDVEEFFPKVMANVDDFSTKVIRDIDKGQLCDRDSFIDRFGYKLYLDNCSTGSKIVLAVKYTDYIILGDEMGSNCDELLLSITEGSIYFTSLSRYFYVYDKEIDVYINSVKCKTTEELWHVVDSIINADEVI